MDSVNNNHVLSGKHIQYGKFTFLNASDKVQKSKQPIDMDTMIWYDQSFEDEAKSWKKYFSDIALSLSPVADTKQEIDEAINTAIQSFFDGNLSESELLDTFQELATQFCDACEEAGYPLPLQGSSVKQSMLETFYSEFRRKILDTAVQRNNQEGKQYFTGEMNVQRSCKYYNSDYYYKSEAAISAITDGVLELARDSACTDFTIPDYKAEGLNLYYNFNSAWSNNFDVSEQYMIDPDQAPPENFKWFYQSGGCAKGVAQVTSLTITSPDGKDSVIDYSPTAFDPANPMTAAMWASYQDADGKEHRISTDIIYNGTKSDLYHVGDLLKFSDDRTSQNTAINRFMQNLQVYSKNYFSRFTQSAAMLNLYA